LARSTPPKTLVKGFIKANQRTKLNIYWIKSTEHKLANKKQLVFYYQGRLKFTTFQLKQQLKIYNTSLNKLPYSKNRIVPQKKLPSFKDSFFNQNYMTYPFIPIGLIIIFLGYVLYLLIIKKDMNKLKPVLFIGLFFIAVWAVIYYFLLK